MDKYETIRKLGQGTYGSVFLCRQKASGKQCVMKRLQLNALNDKERRAALQEANLLKRLDHPNIVAYVDMLSTRSKLFIFMNYCDGGSFSGNNQSVTVHEGTPLYFRGKRVREAVLDSLIKEHGLGKASDVVVSGCSAGGLATFLHTDQWCDALAAEAEGGAESTSSSGPKPMEAAKV